MDNMRRKFLSTASFVGASIGATGIAKAASFGNPDRPPTGAINARTPSSVSDPGPVNPAVADQMPDFKSPPPTDVNGMPLFWSSFNTAHKRIQNGGWARQITQNDFSIAKDFAAVNMRLSAGGIREMHWHQAAEWAYMIYGNCRITTIDEKGLASVEDVEEGDIWYFPPGLPHSLQGIGNDGCEFLIAFDDGQASEFNTLLLTDWFAHTPPEVLAKNFGVPAESFKNIPLDNRWIFQGELPPSLEEDRKAARASSRAEKVIFKLGRSKKIQETKGGHVQIADSRTNFPYSKTVSTVLETVHPGGIREMHWHPNADEWAMVLKGKGRVGVFNTGPQVMTGNFNPGDIWYIRKNYGHYIENTGDEDMKVLALFKSDHFAQVSLSEWLTHIPPEMVLQTLNLDKSTLDRFPTNTPDFMPI